ncbi:class I SAM-dependent methyltransferase [Amycolatopsis albispora]|uniref:Methyltransferase n=1 Tax=Amycolatopsis albispora TaxID=1804986 RepID=A0A344L506_9PSEU|nr:methyltransferase domain-containing protein [Amycolatopsis albispora]AXB43130.1 methyltransferase [Amycolatopsis albispora]
MSITTEFLRHPVLTGAIAPSSRRLAAAMTAGLGLEHARTVVELGPGTGVFTEAILHRLRPGARLVAVELNERLATPLRARYGRGPVTVVHDSAEALASYVDNPVDVVVSGLPWAVLPAAQRDRILDQVIAVLAPEGRFTTFAYGHAAWTPPARRFAASLRERFAVVTRGPLIWPNLPPALVHRAALPLAREGRLTWTFDRPCVNRK